MRAKIELVPRRLGRGEAADVREGEIRFSESVCDVPKMAGSDARLPYTGNRWPCFQDQIGRSPPPAGAVATISSASGESALIPVGAQNLHLGA